MLKSLKDIFFITTLSIISYFLLVSVVLPESKKTIEYEDSSFYKNLYDKTSPSVVGIYTQDSLGSGVFITDNLVLTNNHVIEDAKNFTVTIKIDDKSAEGISVLGKVVFADPANDVALVSIDSHIGTPVAIGDSITTKIGDRVFTIGNPDNLFNTLGVGYITGKYRVMPFGPYIGILQMSTGVIGGQSGGALFNENGELIGITFAASDAGDNFGFAIPINLIKAALKSYIDLTQVSENK